MAVLIATSIIVLMFSGAMMLASRRDIKNEVSVETNTKIFKVTKIITIICALILSFLCLHFFLKVLLEVAVTFAENQQHIAFKDMDIVMNIIKTL